MDEAKLIKRLKKREPQALEVLIGQYSSMVYGLIRRILGEKACSQDIEDCTSEVFAQAWTNIDKFDMSKGQLKTWLLVQARSKALDLIRKLTRLEQPCEGIEPNGAVPSAEERAISREKVRELKEAVATLPLLDRKIFIQRYFFYQEVESIALVLGISRKAVENRLWRARCLLRKRLEQGERRTAK